MLLAREVESGTLFSSRQGAKGAYLSSNLIHLRTLADWPWSGDADECGLKLMNSKLCQVCKDGITVIKEHQRKGMYDCLCSTKRRIHSFVHSYGEFIVPNDPCLTPLIIAGPILRVHRSTVSNVPDYEIS